MGFLHPSPSPAYMCSTRRGCVVHAGNPLPQAPLLTTTQTPAKVAYIACPCCPTYPSSLVHELVHSLPNRVGSLVILVILACQGRGVAA